MSYLASCRIIIIGTSHCQINLALWIVAASCSSMMIRLCQKCNLTNYFAFANIWMNPPLLNCLMASMCSYSLLTGWLLVDSSPSSHPFSLSAFWVGCFRYSADSDGCTACIPGTQAENSTWHFPWRRSTLTLTGRSRALLTTQSYRGKLGAIKITRI